jgi:CBS domain-containing protein
MQVRDIMTANVTCCTPDTGLQDVAHLMVDCHCGCIPVCQSDGSKEPVGMITDRDIVCRAVAEGKNPLDLTAQDCMTTPVVTISPDASIEECCQLMEENLVRRLIVIDEEGICCGVVAQADLALHLPQDQTAEVVKEVSQPTESASLVGASH